MKYFYSFFGIIFQFYFLIFLTEAAQYECSYRRTAHHATVCLFVCLSVRTCISGTAHTNFTSFLHMLPMDVAGFFSGGVVAILWTTPSNGQEQATRKGVYSM